MASEGKLHGVKTVKTSQLGAIVDCKTVLKTPTGVAWVPNSQFSLVVLGSRGKAILFNARTNSLEMKLDLDDASLTCVDVQAKHLVVGTQSGKVHFLDSEDEYRSMETSSAESASVTCIKMATSEHIFAGYSESKILLWNSVKLNKPVLELSNHQNRVVSLDVQNSDPNILLSTDSSDTCKLWDVRLKHSEVFSAAGTGSLGAKFLPNQTCSFIASGSDHSIK